MCGGFLVYHQWIALVRMVAATAAAATSGCALIVASFKKAPELCAWWEILRALQMASP